jgi:hypothetical protein
MARVVQPGGKIVLADFTEEGFAMVAAVPPADVCAPGDVTVSAATGISQPGGTTCAGETGVLQIVTWLEGRESRSSGFSRREEAMGTVNTRTTPGARERPSTRRSPVKFCAPSRPSPRTGWPGRLLIPRRRERDQMEAAIELDARPGKPPRWRHGGSETFEINRRRARALARPSLRMYPHQ